MATIDDVITRIETFIKETSPDVDISPGSVLSELLTKAYAQLHTEITNADIESLSNTKSVDAVLAATGDTYSDAIDAIASNYNTTRNPGSKVTGIIKVTVSGNRSYFIEQGFAFQQPLLKFNYVTVQDYDIVAVGATITSANQLNLIQDGALYYFLLPVEADAAGAEVVNGKNDTVVPNKTPFAIASTTSKIASFVRAEAYGNFSGGENKETDLELITRFKEGLSYKALTSPIAMSSVFSSVFAPNFKTLSVVGANDSELLRAKNNLFGISTLGMADTYIRTSNTVQTTNVVMQGVLVNATTWRISVPAYWVNPLVPAGYYRITSVAPVESGYSGTYLITKITYDYDKPATGRINDISTAQDARYTKYQTCDVEFECFETTATKNFSVSFSYMPLIADIQDYVLADNNRIVTADYLVKAIVPCHVTLGLRLYRKDPLVDLPVVNIKRDIFNYINGLQLGEDLVVSSIIDICHNYKVKRVDLPVVVTGNIWVPNTVKDETITIKSDDVLVLPSYPSKGVTKNTTAFFTTYFDVSGVENIGIEQV